MVDFETPSLAQPAFVERRRRSDRRAVEGGAPALFLSQLIATARPLHADDGPRQSADAIGAYGNSARCALKRMPQGYRTTKLA
jgi:hypothetical protein